MKLPRVNRKNRCKICGKPDYCGFTPDGNLAICMRVPSDKPSKNGGWIHPLGENKPKVSFQSPFVESKPIVHKPDSAHLHAVYSAFLNQLQLIRNHYQMLRARGLDDRAIFLSGYKTMPAIPYSNGICKRLAEDFDLRHVPGFYFQQDAWHFVDYFKASGYLVPIRNARHEIVAMALRRDDNRKPKYLLISSADKPRGASSGTPPHFATLGKAFKKEEVKSLIVTEGALKANIIAEHVDDPVVGLVGVGCFDETFPTLLKNSYPNLVNVKVAFDMDAASNVQVKLQRDRLCLTLKKIKLQVSVLSWNRSEGKGFDDYLVNKSRQNKKEAKRAA